MNIFSWPRPTATGARWQEESLLKACPFEYIPPIIFHDSAEPEPNYPVEDVGFTPPAGFRISIPDELVSEPEAVLVESEPPPVTESEPDPETVTVAEMEPVPMTVPEPEPPAVPVIEPELETQKTTPVSVTEPTRVRLPALPALPPRKLESDGPARPPRPRTPREKAKPEYDPEPVVEGGRKFRTNYAVVRESKLRAMAIQIHGRNCCVCSFNFDAFFGPELAQGYIEIHHLKKIADGERITDPATDLAPLCGNCHAMADRLAGTLANPPATIEELKRLLAPPSHSNGQSVS